MILDYIILLYDIIARNITFKINKVIQIIDFNRA